MNRRPYGFNPQALLAFYFLLSQFHLMAFISKLLKMAYKYSMLLCFTKRSQTTKSPISPHTIDFQAVENDIWLFKATLSHKKVTKTAQSKPGSTYPSYSTPTLMYSCMSISKPPICTISLPFNLSLNHLCVRVPKHNLILCSIAG